VKFNYYLVRTIGYLLALLPLRFLYLLARITAWFFQYILKYRKDVVLQNLHNSFPEKHPKEIKDIAVRFYRIFMETMFETIKLLRMDSSYIPGRIQISNPEILQKYYQEGRSVVAVCGHYGNWEWMGTGFNSVIPFQTIAVYKPLSNKAIDRLMFKVRSQNGTKLIPVKNSIRRIQAEPGPICTFLIADQSPGPDNAYWMPFLNQDTPVFLGPERIARLTNSAVVFLNTRRSGIGRYTISLEEICSNPHAEPEGAITEKHVKALEKLIREDPAPWLWSHKRWKHKRRA